nr:hypothetical protein [Betaproteobacteria bacterium]
MYEVTDDGTGGNPWQLTRAQDASGNDFTVGVANASGPFQALQARVQELEGRNRELQGQLDESERGKRELRTESARHNARAVNDDLRDVR